MQKVKLNFPKKFILVKKNDHKAAVIQTDEGLFLRRDGKLTLLIAGNIPSPPTMNNEGAMIFNKIYQWLKITQKNHPAADPAADPVAEWDNGELFIKIGTAAARFKFSALKWRAIENLKEEQQQSEATAHLCTLPATLLKEIKKQMFYSNDYSRPSFLNPVVDTEKSRLLCTDGRLLAIYPLPVFTAPKGCTRYVSVEIREWIGGDIDIFEKSQDEDIKFPNYEDIIPVAVGKVIFNPTEAESTLKSILPALDHETKKVIVKITKNKIIFSGENVHSKVETEIPAESTHEFEAAYYANNLLKAFNSGCAEMSFYSSTAPAILKSEKLFTLAMPMKHGNRVLTGKNITNLDAWEAVARLAHPAYKNEKTLNKNGGPIMEAKKQETTAKVAEKVTIKLMNSSGMEFIYSVPAADAAAEIAEKTAWGYFIPTGVETVVITADCAPTKPKEQKAKKPVGQIIVCAVPECTPSELAGIPPADAATEIIEVITGNTTGGKNCDFVELKKVDAYLTKKAEAGFYPITPEQAPACEVVQDAINTAVVQAIGKIQENPELVPDSLVDDLIAPEHSDPNTCDSLTRLAHPDALEFVNKEEFAPRFIIKMFTNRERTKIYAPEIFPVAYADEKAVICKAADGKEYRYNRDNFGKIRLAKHGKGSASLNILMAQRPSMEEIAKISAQLLDEIR